MLIKRLKIKIIATFILTIPVTQTFAQTKFLDAAQIRPILDATKGSWVAVREYGGQDLLYFSHLLAWRCGLTEISYALNDATDFTPWPFAPCDEASPNPAAIPDNQKIYTRAPLNSIDTVTLRITYDDATTDETTYTRKSIQID